MRTAPAVSVTVARSSWHVRAIFLLAGLGWLPLAFYGASWDWLPVTSFLFTLLVLWALAWRAWSRTPSGRLQWDGEFWLWSCGGDSCRVAVELHWDFQKVLLVRIRPTEGTPTWLWLESDGKAQGWLALRRALVASGQKPDLSLEYPVAQRDLP